MSKTAWEYIKWGGIPVSKRRPKFNNVRDHLCWNLLDKEDRYWGFEMGGDYGHQWPGFGFWYFHFYLMFW